MVLSGMDTLHRSIAGCSPLYSAAIYVPDTILTHSGRNCKGFSEKSVVGKAGKIKYSLSRMSPIMPQLLEAGVNCYYISPSQNDIRLSFEQLTHEIAVNQLQKHQPAAIDILLPSGKAADSCDPAERKNRYEALKRLINKNLYNFILRDTRSGFRISTDYETVKQITDSFTSCLLGDYIRQNGDYQICIGYGLGTRWDRPRPTRKTQQRSPGSAGGRAATLSIKAALSITGAEEVTTQELSRALHITVRSVNRIVSVLMRSGLAKALYSKQTGTKGRPSKVYQFYLNP